MSEFNQPVENQNFQPVKSLPNSTAVLVLGILSIFSCAFYGVIGLVLGIIALVLHKKDKAIYNANPIGYEASFKNSQAGHVCAIIGVSLSALFLLFVLVYVIFILGLFASFAASSGAIDSIQY
jgi:membrane glycosyltransferase